MFNAAEKVQVGKYPNGMMQWAEGVRRLQALCETSAHTAIRPALHDALYGASSVWEHASKWFADLSGTPGQGITESRDRNVVLAEAQGHYTAMLAAFDPLLAATATAPDFLAADAQFKTARTTLSGFDWSLGYSNPNHADNPNTPFDEPKTVVGPHGDWMKATASLKYVADHMTRPLRIVLDIYRTVPVYSQTANHAFKEQIRRFANMMDKLARVWAMHVEVETPGDAAIINGDFAATSGKRTRDFFRTLVQTELVFNNRTSVGQNWRGRNNLRGIVEDLRGSYFQEFIVPLARADGNGKPWAYSLVVGGMHEEFHRLLHDFWQALDSWSHAAFGFYHPLPDPAQFTPVTPDGSNTTPETPPAEPTVVPLGYFDAEAAQIAAAKADAAAVSAGLDQVLASLRAKEGTDL